MTHTRSCLRGAARAARRLAAALALLLTLPTTANAQAIDLDEFRVGLSVSPWAQASTFLGVRYTDGQGAPARNMRDLQRLYNRHGATELYARVSSYARPREDKTDYSLDAALDRCRLAASLRMPINLELGLFGADASITHQVPPDFSQFRELDVPGEWTDLTLDQMCVVLRDYGELVARRVEQTRCTVNVWSLGTQADFGVAGVAIRPLDGSGDDEVGRPNWYVAPDNIDPAIGRMDLVSLIISHPDARAAWLREHLWPHEARLLAAAQAGVRAVFPDAVFSTHIALSNDPVHAVAFFESMAEFGYDCDIPAVSFMPFFGDDPNAFDHLKDTITAIHEATDKPVFVAEFAYPAAQVTGLFAEADMLELNDYPYSERNQAKLLHDLVTWGVDHGVCGVRPWAPDLLIPGMRLWDDLAFFTFDEDTNEASARPVLMATWDALATARAARDRAAGR